MPPMTQKTLTFTEQVNLKIYICMQFTSFRKDVSVFRFYNIVATTDDPLEYLSTHPDYYYYYYYSIINNVAQLLLMKEYRIVTNTTRSIKVENTLFRTGSQIRTEGGQMSSHSTLHCKLVGNCLTFFLLLLLLLLL